MFTVTRPTLILFFGPTLKFCMTRLVNNYLETLFLPSNIVFFMSRGSTIMHGPFDILWGGGGGGAGIYVWAGNFFSCNIGARLFSSLALQAGLFFLYNQKL